MLNKTVYEWVGVNSHSMSWPVGTGPGLYKQIVVDDLLAFYVTQTDRPNTFFLIVKKALNLGKIGKSHYQK